MRKEKKVITVGCDKCGEDLLDMDNGKIAVFDNENDIDGVDWNFESRYCSELDLRIPKVKFDFCPNCSYDETTNKHVNDMNYNEIKKWIAKAVK